MEDMDRSWEIRRRGSPPPASAELDLEVCAQVFGGTKLGDFSFSIEDAWHVVEEMEKRGWDFVLEYDHPESMCLVVGFRRIGPDGWIEMYSVESINPAEGICSAALQALMPETEA